jgi:hypothetical protein
MNKLNDLSACRVLKLNRNELGTLVKASAGSSDVLTSMLMDRHRPIQCQGVTIHIQNNTEKIKLSF